MDRDSESAIMTVHPEILQSLILTRLDGPTLAAISCASPELLSLSNGEQLWKRICSDTWPSIEDTRVQQAVSQLRHGHRSLFSDSYPLLHYNNKNGRDGRVKLNRRCPASVLRTETSKLISTVDIYYKGVPIMSKVVETETSSSWFMCTPFRVDLLEPKEMVHTPIKNENVSRDTHWLRQLEENMTLSWIVIDPSRNRAMNVSTRRAVSARSHWLTGEVQVKFSSIMGTGRTRGGQSESVECGVVVTCGGAGEERVGLREVSLVMEDMEGKSLSGKDSLVILQGAMEGGERKLMGKEMEGKVKFEEFLQKKRIWKENKENKEKALDLACVTFGIILFFSFWLYIFLK